MRATATRSLRSLVAGNRLGDDLTDVPSADSNHAFLFRLLSGKQLCRRVCVSNSRFNSIHLKYPIDETQKLSGLNLLDEDHGVIDCPLKPGLLSKKEVVAWWCAEFNVDVTAVENVTVGA